MSPERRTNTTEGPQFNVEWDRLLNEALDAPGQMGDTYSSFYRFSLLNQMLVRMQGVNEPIATYKGWQALDRQVQKGSKAKAIYRPLFRKELNSVGVEEQRLSGFKLVNCIFGVSETQGADLPEVEPQEWSKERALGSLAIAQVAFDHIDGNVQGFSHNREIAVSPVASYPFKTLTHEIGHVVLGDTVPGMQEEYKQHRGLAEFGAESTAYLVMHELGMDDHMDAAGSRSYIQGWLQGHRPDDTAIRQVFSATDRILRAGRQVAARLRSSGCRRGGLGD